MDARHKVHPESCQPSSDTYRQCRMTVVYMTHRRQQSIWSRLRFLHFVGGFRVRHLPVFSDLHGPSIWPEYERVLLALRMFH